LNGDGIQRKVATPINPNSAVEMALVSGTGFQPVGFGEQLGKNLPQLPVATGQARCLSHYRRPMPTSEFGLNRGKLRCSVGSSLEGARKIGKLFETWRIGIKI
jgi:hypothetical protein